MEEVNNPHHSMGSGQPHHPVNHTRPFFYVQPPSQPYYMYQWHMNNPYGHYGFPGSGIPFGRPYMAPYPYMQYPGYIMPHAPMQPVDYRRTYNPHFPCAASYDVRFRHHHTRMRRETACSEAQTDPSDVVNKLIESLDKLRTRNTVAEKELDSGIISQNSFLPGGDLKHEGPSEDLEALPAKSSPLLSSVGARLSTSVVLFSTSAGAERKSESSQSHYEMLAQEEGWSVSSDGVLPLDSSSIHEESVAQKEEHEEEEEQQQQEEEEEEEKEEEKEFQLHRVPEKLSLQMDGSGRLADCNNQTACGVEVQSELVQGQQPGSAQDCKEPSKNIAGPAWPSPESLLPPSQLSSWLVEEVAGEGAEHGSNEVSMLPQAFCADTVGGKNDVPEKPGPEPEDLPYRILRLPCDKVTTARVLQKDNPLWYMDSLSTLIPPHTYLSSLGNAAYYYSYYPPTAQERQSVLSPSLDELSSRDEMFSTDLEDMDLISGHIYTGGRLAEAPREPQEAPASEGNVKTGSFHQECLVCPKMKMCGSCGSSLLKQTKRGRAHHSPGAYDYHTKEDTDEEVIEEEDDDEEDDKALRNTCEPRKASMKRLPSSKRPLQLPPVRRMPKHIQEHKCKKGCCEGPGDPIVPKEQKIDYPVAPECCEEHKAMAKAEKYKGLEPRNSQSRPHLDRQWRESSMASDQESWESCVKLRPKSCKSHPSRGQERPLRRTTCKEFVCQRPHRTDYEDEEGELPRFHRGRGSTKRRHKMQN